MASTSGHQVPVLPPHNPFQPELWVKGEGFDNMPLSVAGNYLEILHEHAYKYWRAHRISFDQFNRDFIYNIRHEFLRAFWELRENYRPHREKKIWHKVARQCKWLEGIPDICIKSWFLDLVTARYFNLEEANPIDPQGTTTTLRLIDDINEWTTAKIPELSPLWRSTSLMDIKEGHALVYKAPRAPLPGAMDIDEGGEASPWSSEDEDEQPPRQKTTRPPMTTAKPRVPNCLRPNLLRPKFKARDKAKPDPVNNRRRFYRLEPKPVHSIKAHDQPFPSTTVHKRRIAKEPYRGPLHLCRGSRGSEEQEYLRARLDSQRVRRKISRTDTHRVFDIKTPKSPYGYRGVELEKRVRMRCPDKKQVSIEDLLEQQRLDSIEAEKRIASRKMAPPSSLQHMCLADGKGY